MAAAHTTTEGTGTAGKKASVFSALLMILLTIFSSAAWITPLDERSINHQFGTSLALEVGGPNALGTVTRTFYWRKDIFGDANKTIVSAATGNQTWIPPPTAFGRLELSYTATNGSVGENATIDVNVKNYNSDDIKDVTVDNIVEYFKTLIIFIPIIVFGIIIMFLALRVRRSSGRIM